MLLWSEIEESRRMLKESVQVSAQVSDTVNPILQKGQKQQKCKLEQMEFESIVGPVDDMEAKKRHLEEVRRRYFFGYYLKCKDQEKKLKLIDSYNLACRLGNKRDGR